MPSTLVSVSAAFFLGAAYEVAAAYWARAAVARKPYSATSAGILIRSDAEGVSLTLDEWRDPAEDLAVTQQGRQSFIPRAMITREIQIPAARWRRMVRPKGSIRKASAPKLTGTP